MKNKKPLSIISILFALMLLMPLNLFSNKTNDKRIVSEIIDDDEIGTELKPIVLIETPDLSSVSLDPWWNGTFRFRMLINITNLNAVDLNDYITSIEFNYTELVSQDKMNSTLKDIRIVENGALREYYYQQNYPSSDIATVWFKNNCSASTTEFDTFLYYGNNSVEPAVSYLMAEHPAGEIWYRFDEGSGTTAIDSLGNYNGTLINGPSYTTGKVGSNALIFDGGNDYIAIRDKSYVNPGEIPELTVMCWFRTTYGGGSWTSNWAFFDYDRSETFNFFIAGDNGRIGFSTKPQTGSIDDFYTTSTGWNDNQWHFACVVYDGTNKYIYIDPDAGQAEVSGFGNNPHSGSNLGSGTDRFGFVGDGSEASTYNGNRNNIYFLGSIDEVRFFPYALSDKDIEAIYKNYVLNTELNEEQERKAQVKFTTLDVDGRIVPNAEVSLYNGTDGIWLSTKNSSTDGSVIFTNLDFGEYNVTVNYTINSGLEAIVFNSSDSSYGNYNFTLIGLYHIYDLELKMWTIDFEIVDVDKYPINYGYINVSINSTSSILEKLPLDNEGKATFRWLNRSSYYYRVFYENEDYNPIITPLNTSDINRSAYVQNQKFYTHTIDVNTTNRDTGGTGTFEVRESFYANGSRTDVSNKKILKANITLADMDDHLDEVKIYYIDEEGNSPGDHLIFQNLTYMDTDKDDFIEIDMRNTPETCAKLMEDNYEVFGLYIVVEGQNSTQCNGTIKVELIETCNIYNTTSLAKIHIEIIDETTYSPVPSVIVHVFNSTTDSVVNLTTDVDGFAYGQQNSDIGFWYLSGNNYTFTLEFFGEENKPFTVNDTDPEQWEPINVQVYNYTLQGNSSVIFQLIINPSLYITDFIESSGDNIATWGQSISYTVNFSSSTNGWGGPWTPITQPDDITATIKDFDGVPVSSKPMTDLGNGYFTATFSSGILSAGDSSITYTVEITGNKVGYSDPIPETFLLQVNAIQTDMSLHNWSNLTQTLTEVTQYYNELINITVSYYVAGSPGSRLPGAKLDYTWDYGSGSDIGEDPMHSEYYTFEINTSSAPSTASYGIDISVSLGNYTTKNFIAYVNILSRTTTLNGTTTLKHISKNVWIKDAYNFTFEYNDTTGIDNQRVGDLETASYYWYKIDANGTPIGTPSPKFNLNLTTDKLYVLDFDTESRDIGDYAIFVTLQKNNYESRNAFIDLTIEKRTISHTFTATNLEGSQINIVKGADISFRLDLKDNTRNLADLNNATVVLTIGSDQYEFAEDESGTYERIFSTINIDTLIMPQTLSGKIEISKEDYISVEFQITIVVGMEEIFAGIPLFYFILIVSAIAIVVGGIGGYKAIQYSRIPEFTKKVNKMKKAIKSNKAISESLATETKMEYMVDRLSDKWDKLSLSLKETLEIKGKKLEEIKKESIETLQEPSEPERGYLEPEEEPSEPEREYPESEEEPIEPEREYPEPEEEPSEPERGYPEPEEEPSEPEIEEEPHEPESEYPEPEEEPSESERKYYENQEGGDEE